MAIEHDGAIRWDGEALTGSIIIDGVPTQVRADRDFIHRNAAGFNDAVTWEIERHRAEIFEKLIPQWLEDSRG